MGDQSVIGIGAHEIEIAHQFILIPAGQVFGLVDIPNRIDFTDNDIHAVQMLNDLSW